MAIDKKSNKMLVASDIKGTQQELDKVSEYLVAHSNDLVGGDERGFVIPLLMWLNKEVAPRVNWNMVFWVFCASSIFIVSRLSVWVTPIVVVLGGLFTTLATYKRSERPTGIPLAENKLDILMGRSIQVSVQEPVLHANNNVGMIHFNGKYIVASRQSEYHFPSGLTRMNIQSSTDLNTWTTDYTFSDGNDLREMILFEMGGKMFLYFMTLVPLHKTFKPLNIFYMTSTDAKKWTEPKMVCRKGEVAWEIKVYGAIAYKASYLGAIGSRRSRSQNCRSAFTPVATDELRPGDVVLVAATFERVVVVEVLAPPASVANASSSSSKPLLALADALGVDADTANAASSNKTKENSSDILPEASALHSEGASMETVSLASTPALSDRVEIASGNAVLGSAKLVEVPIETAVEAPVLATVEVSVTAATVEPCVEISVEALLETSTEAGDEAALAASTSQTPLDMSAEASADTEAEAVGAASSAETTPDTPADAPAEAGAAASVATSSAETTLDMPLETPVEAGAGAAVAASSDETTLDTPADEPPEAGAEATVARNSAETPLDMSANTPAGAVADAAVAASSAETILDMPTDTPLETAVDVPAESIVSEAVEADVQAPVEAPPSLLARTTVLDGGSAQHSLILCRFPEEVDSRGDSRGDNADEEGVVFRSADLVWPASGPGNNHISEELRPCHGELRNRRELVLMLGSEAAARECWAEAKAPDEVSMTFASCVRGHLLHARCFQGRLLAGRGCPACPEALFVPQVQRTRREGEDDCCGASGDGAAAQALGEAQAAETAASEQANSAPTADHSTDAPVVVEGTRGGRLQMKMCPVCCSGPLLNENCSDLRAHHGQCPRCQSYPHSSAAIAEALAKNNSMSVGERIPSCENCNVSVTFNGCQDCGHLFCDIDYENLPTWDASAKGCLEVSIRHRRAARLLAEQVRYEAALLAHERAALEEACGSGVPLDVDCLMEPPPPPVPLPPRCGVKCQRRHRGPCLVCDADARQHEGHFCPDGRRGSWLLVVGGSDEQHVDEVFDEGEEEEEEEE